MRVAGAKSEPYSVLQHLKSFIYGRTLGKYDFWSNSLKRARPQDVGFFSHMVDDALNHVNRLDSYLNFILFHMPKR
jgi:hypothetical protein